ncbi:hypothetical protein [Mucilaginibacter flavus]|uniref:hypothetical protein n=1 Tax=Mucilaginibacter flavus TaxID=931504 RepID=UPI0025B5C306|nr:hypothetical protein [Mucilaginibacter flavus]
MKSLDFIQKLSHTLTLVSNNHMAEAEREFRSLNIVGTPDHLAQIQRIRHLVWDLNELLVVRNVKNINRDELINEYSEYFIS